MKPIQRRIAPLIACVLAASALTSCSSPNALAVFDEQQSKADTMPAGATPSVVEGINSDTTRLLWTDAGLSYYAALSGAGDPCLVILGEREAVSGCSGSVPVMVQVDGNTEMLLADNLPDSSADWTKVADHLWAAN
ncbi:MAG: hypothetical protein R6W83_04645 [Cryobacterium sp.]